MSSVQSQVVVPGGCVRFLSHEWRESWPLAYGQRQHIAVVKFDLCFDSTHGRVQAFQKLWHGPNGLEDIFMSMELIKFPPKVINDGPRSDGVTKIWCTFDLSEVFGDVPETIAQTVTDLFLAITSRYPAPAADDSDEPDEPQYVNDATRLSGRHH